MSASHVTLYTPIPLQQGSCPLPVPAENKLLLIWSDFFKVVKGELLGNAMPIYSTPVSRFGLVFYVFCLITSSILPNVYVKSL